jgi:hypothetical protein
MKHLYSTCFVSSSQQGWQLKKFQYRSTLKLSMVKLVRVYIGFCFHYFLVSSIAVFYEAFFYCCKQLRKCVIIQLLEAGSICKDVSTILKFNLAPVYLSKILRSISSENSAYQARHVTQFLIQLIYSFCLEFNFLYWTETRKM